MCKESFERPKFTLSLTYDEFKKHYWYKSELCKICSTYKISPVGTKAELELRIGQLLGGLDNSQDKKTIRHSNDDNLLNKNVNSCNSLPN